MPDKDFAGFVAKPGESTDLIQAEDNTPAPPKPDAPKPPSGWDMKSASYKMAHEARKK
jgi:hypothetical protein